MFGLSLLYFYSYSAISNTLNYKRFGKLICNMINLDPEERYNPAEAYESFTKLLKGQISVPKTVEYTPDFESYKESTKSEKQKFKS